VDRRLASQTHAQKVKAMGMHLAVLGEALMDCIAQSDGRLLPLMGGSPYNMARAAARRGASVSYLNPLSSDTFGQGLAQRLRDDGVSTVGGTSVKPTSLAVVQLHQGQPSYGFYREGIADRDYTPDSVLARLPATPGVLHTGSLLLVPPEHEKALAVLQAARARGWTISVDVNLRVKLAADVAAYVQAVRSVLPHVDWLKASDEDLAVLGFDGTALPNAAHLVAQLRAVAGPGQLSRVALTFGAEGAHLDIQGQSAQAAAPQVNVVDTVGAGDTFWGNCLADWCESDTLATARVAQTLHWAMQAAAINCTRAGCEPPTWAEVQAR
jgi:fructokinase